MRGLMSTAIVAGVVAVLVAAPPDTTIAAATSTAPVLQEEAGKAIFEGKGNCFTCHNQDATGTPLGPDLTDSEWINFEDGRPSREQVEALVREGIAQPVEHPAPMPPMGGASLSDEEITRVAEYVLSLTAE